MPKLILTFLPPVVLSEPNHNLNAKSFKSHCNSHTNTRFLRCRSRTARSFLLVVLSWEEHRGSSRHCLETGKTKRLPRSGSPPGNQV
jgi:hypothetical protein